jgi:hypothetical protein
LIQRICVIISWIPCKNTISASHKALHSTAEKRAE